jgi:histidinol-phosphatase (PHP family)
MLDMHSHHDRCGHATGGLEAYVRAAIARGLRFFGMSDHAPLFGSDADHPMPHVQMAKSEFESYVRQAFYLKEAYRDRIALRVGVEADFIQGTQDAYATALKDARLDFVIGSVHWFHGAHVYMPETWDRFSSPDELYAAYFTTVQEAARSGLFDVLGHIDALKAMGPERPPSYRSLVDETIEVIADSGVVVELNTSGVRKCGEVFPDRESVRALHAAGVGLTYGSDCHAPGEVAYGWAEVQELLVQMDVGELVVFEKRVPQRYSLMSGVTSG